MKKPILFGLVILLSSCFLAFKSQSKIKDETATKPNILWLVAEDMSPYIAAFGDSTIETPNLAWLAREGVCFDNVYSPSPVCAPSRAALATGMYPTQIGANHMRTGPWFATPLRPYAQKDADKQLAAGEIFYEATPAPEVKMLSEHLRRAGYYCTNNFKEDYQFQKPVTAWDESSLKAHWRNRAKGQPFFSMITFMVSHESQIWQKAKDSLWVDKNLNVPVPPYLPNTEIAKNDIRRMYSNIKEMDAQVGKIIQQLKEDGELDNTIIVWFADHGGPLPRQKRAIFDSGLRVPLIVRFPNKQFAQTRENRLISFIDFAPTMLSLANITPPKYMNGKAFLGKYTQPERKYIFAASDRYDESTDAIRAARDHRFKYIKYYKPELPMYLSVKYRDDMPIMKELNRLRDEGKLTDTQALWFRKTKPQEELFDTKNDPHEVHDIANDPKYQAKLVELRTACASWVKETKDLNLIPEKELMAKFLPNGVQPITEKPQVTVKSGTVNIRCKTLGASIGYKYIQKGGDTGTSNWQVYIKPIKLETGKELVVLAHRIGFKASEIVHLSN